MNKIWRNKILIENSICIYIEYVHLMKNGNVYAGNM